MLTPEKRQQILRGDDGLGHQDATRAPLHMQDRIIEIRLAKAEHRDIPAPSSEYVRTAEKRSLAMKALNFGRKVLAPITKPSQSVSLRDDRDWQRTVQAAFRLLADNAAREEQRIAEAAEASEEVRLTVFPWEARRS